MLKIEVSGDCLRTLNLEGEVTEIVAELGTVIGAMYNEIRMVSPDAARIFRAMVQVAVMPGSPAWQEVERKGGIRQCITVPKILGRGEANERM